MSKKKDALGKGIRALLENLDDEQETYQIQPKEKEVEKETTPNTIAEISITEIEVNPFQPRATFDDDALNELADSIRIHGVIQPVTVRKLGPSKYQLIAGERRLRASHIAGLKTVPAYIRLANDQEALEIALIENIQREDLNAMEISINYQRLIDECALTHDDLGSRLGKNRSTVTNYLRLLKLPPEIQDGLRQRKISMGHARALVGIEEVDRQLYAYRAILSKSLSVRKTEEFIKQLLSEKVKPKTPSSRKLPHAYQEVQHRLMDHFETKVSLKKNKGDKGEIVIPFYSANDLNRIIDLIEGSD